MDGRHCPIINPQFSGTEFYNYKHFFSVVLMAVVNAEYDFLCVNVGAQGRISDGGVFSNCSFNAALNDGSLNLPEPSPLLGREMEVPWVLVADDAFPLSEHRHGASSNNSVNFIALACVQNSESVKNVSSKIFGNHVLLHYINHYKWKYS